ncbi:tryptophan synthase subunit alpha [Gordonia sp. ABSL1-1]|uniref:tryptophan synthase subunit alpha n=1 Tax=Gordonia sp. ABSL1-1 TaxID=3053923 RepID=UPI002572B5C2|nr:tryptophan synthase subunit alpha [Gordonia sp. ABSL1-1]MDL9938123.1 tryptophan synthase subunit alpha [Gordonia sp. ABSL1-1]
MTATTGPSKLGPVFAGCRAEGRAALIGYLPVGFPTVEDSVTSFRTMVDAGCDIIEVGVPYSDPVMDGPTIQAAADTALQNGVRVRDVFTAVEAIAAAGGQSVVMSYWNPVLQYGVDKFARDLANAGGAGVITPNLIPEEGAAWHAASDDYGLDRIYLVAPSSTPERIALTVDASRGFVYAASTMGVTGARDAVSDMAPDLCARVRAYSDIPIGVGLGVRNREQAAEIAAYSDGVIVGSALVTAAHAGQDRLAELVADLAEGVRGRHATV